MKRTLIHALATLALIMTFSLAAYAGHENRARHDETDAAETTATQTASGQTVLRADGHLTKSPARDR